MSYKVVLDVDRTLTGNQLIPSGFGNFQQSETNFFHLTKQQVFSDITNINNGAHVNNSGWLTTDSINKLKPEGYALDAKFDHSTVDYITLPNQSNNITPVMKSFSSIPSEKYD